MPATLCKAMYLSAVMKVPSSRGSCTSRSHPHFSHVSDIHWGGSELVAMSASFQNLAQRRDPLATNCPSPERAVRRGSALSRVQGGSFRSSALRVEHQARVTRSVCASDVAGRAQARQAAGVGSAGGGWAH
jgi:hypothetical protein